MIHLEGITKSFYLGTDHELEVLHGIGLEVNDGEFVSIVGESGSGKSTLMNIIGLLDHATSGRYFMEGVDISAVRESALCTIRNRQIGFVFQTYNLIPRTSAQKNVEMPMLYAGVRPQERAERAMALLQMVGMEDRAKHNPDELSGGQRQRVAIARAMANDPAIILADEPTGALDSRTGRSVMDLFHRLHEEEGKTIILITHSKPLAEETDRILTLIDGRITREQQGPFRAHGVPAPDSETLDSDPV
ncbi:MAG: ABC transporter ATP-binding protein [Lachnospiraceae bacterium]|nr:ABC transporter ATP-binding protein [Lachnospiraceae bacterium]